MPPRLVTVQFPTNILQGVESRLRGRMYSSSSDRPRNVQVTTCNEGPNSRFTRYPHIEAHFNPAPQPYVHSCSVEVWDGGHHSLFTVFYKRHRRLPWNRSLPPIRIGNKSSLIKFRGDFLTLRVASNNPDSYVNMRGIDPTLSDFIVTR
jgi:hypothetical protein